MRREREREAPEDGARRASGEPRRRPSRPRGPRRAGRRSRAAHTASAAAAATAAEEGEDPHRGSSTTIRQPCAVRRVDADRAAVQVDDPARDREPEPAAAVVGRARPVAAVEALEDALGLLRRDPGPSSSTSSRAHPFRRARAQRRPRRRPGEWRIAFATRLSSTCRSRCSSASRTGAAARPRPRARRALRGAGSPLGRDASRAGRAALTLVRSSSTAPDSSFERSSSCSHELAEPLDLAEEVLEHGRVGRLDAVDEVLELRAQRADRRPQLVGRVRDQVAAHALDLLELGGHRVERARELADLVARGGGDAPAVVALRHRAGRGDHLAQRERHPVREQLHHRERQHGGDEARSERRARRARSPSSDDDDRHRDRGDDDDAELQLDRAEAVERSHRNPFVSSAYPIPCTVRMVSAPSLRRIARTCESTVRSPGADPVAPDLLEQPPPAEDDVRRLRRAGAAARTRSASGAPRAVVRAPAAWPGR